MEKKSKGKKVPSQPTKATDVKVKKKAPVKNSNPKN
jgi:hypothetical protein